MHCIGISEWNKSLGIDTLVSTVPNISLFQNIWVDLCFSELSLLTQSPTMSQKYTPEIGKQGRADFTPGRADFVPSAAGG